MKKDDGKRTSSNHSTPTKDTSRLKDVAPRTITKVERTNKQPRVSQGQTPAKQKSRKISRRHSVNVKPRTPKVHTTLRDSYHRYQENYVKCDTCLRRFAPSGAEQHIAICQKVENRPKSFRKTTTSAHRRQTFAVAS